MSPQLETTTSGLESSKDLEERAGPLGCQASFSLLLKMAVSRNGIRNWGCVPHTQWLFALFRLNAWAQSWRWLICDMTFMKFFMSYGCWVYTQMTYLWSCDLSVSSDSRCLLFNRHSPLISGISLSLSQVCSPWLSTSLGFFLCFLNMWGVCLFISLFQSRFLLYFYFIKKKMDIGSEFLSKFLNYPMIVITIIFKSLCARYLRKWTCSDYFLKIWWKPEKKFFYIVCWF